MGGFGTQTTLRYDSAAFCDSRGVTQIPNFCLLIAHRLGVLDLVRGLETDRHSLSSLASFLRLPLCLRVRLVINWLPAAAQDSGPIQPLAKTKNGIIIMQ